MAWRFYDDTGKLQTSGVPSGGGGGSTITVAELDGTPSVASVDTVKFDQSDGFSVTDNSDGSVTIGLSAGGAYSDEQAQDAVGAMIADTATIDLTYTDATPELKADVKAASITEAMQVLADNTTQDVSTTKHGYVPKLTAPSSGIRNIAAIDNGETALKLTALFDTTNPANLGTAGPGTSLIAARRDHIHNTPAGGGGVLVQSIYAQSVTHDTLSTHIPADDTIPQNTEGTQILTVTITPTSASNRVRIHFSGYFAGDNSDYLTVALFQDSGAGAIAAVCDHSGGANRSQVVPLVFEHVPATTSAVTYKIRAGGHAATFYTNGISTTRLFGGVALITLTATELTP